MKPRMKENLMKALFFIVFFIVLILQSIFTNAQSARKTEYKGLDVNFGTRSFINKQMQVNVGITFGVHR